MPEFHGLRDAARLAGKSISTFRRLVRSIVADEQHPDRQFLLPTVEEVRRLKAEGEQFAWTISDELLNREFGNEAARDAAARMPERGAEPLAELIALLREQLQENREQLKVKDQQIASQTEIIQSFNERLREGNILIGSLQQQLALPEVTQKFQTTKPQPTQPQGKKPKKPETAVAQSTMKKPVRKGFFGRLFGQKSKLPRT